MKLQLIRPAAEWACLALLLGIFISLPGCGAAEGEHGEQGHGHDHDHEHAHRPDSLHEAVAELERIEQSVRSAIESGDPDAAHDPLHEVAGLLKAIPDVAAETDLSKDDWEAVKQSSDRLFVAYGVVDKTFHVKDGDQQAAYEEVSGELSDALSEIRSRLPLTGEEVDDHEHGDGEAHDHEHESDHETEVDSTTASEETNS